MNSFNRKALTAAILAALSLELAGCALPGFSTQSLSAEQLKASAADKNASAVCATGTGPWGKVNTVYVNVDKSSISNGTVSVDSECKVSVTTAASPPK